MKDPERPIPPITEGYVRKGGHNPWPSQVKIRPPLPGPMCAPGASTKAVEAAPPNQEADMTDPERPIPPITEGYVRKGGHNPWPSRVTTRPPLPGPMTRPRASTSKVEIEPSEDPTE